jgi:hypothetical protein
MGGSHSSRFMSIHRVLRLGLWRESHLDFLCRRLSV